MKKGSVHDFVYVIHLSNIVEAAQIFGAFNVVVTFPITAVLTLF